jgi:hypothetical protein
MAAVAETASARDYRVCLAELHDAIARADRWYAARERQFAVVARRAADTERRLIAAGAANPREYRLRGSATSCGSERPDSLVRTTSPSASVARHARLPATAG